jgi:hypothetical protein
VDHKNTGGNHIEMHLEDLVGTFDDSYLVAFSF